MRVKVQPSLKRRQSTLLRNTKRTTITKEEGITMISHTIVNLTTIVKATEPKNETTITGKETMMIKEPTIRDPMKREKTTTENLGMKTDRSQSKMLKKLKIYKRKRIKHFMTISTKIRVEDQDRMIIIGTKIIATEITTIKIVANTKVNEIMRMTRISKDSRRRNTTRKTIQSRNQSQSSRRKRRSPSPTMRMTCWMWIVMKARTE